MRVTVALLIAILAGVANAQDAPVAFITVSGDGHAHVAPDFAEFSAEVITRAESLDVATQKHGERVAKAAKALGRLEKYALAVERSFFRLEQSPPGGAKGAQKAPAPTYRAITAFSLKANQIASLNESFRPSPAPVCSK